MIVLLLACGRPVSVVGSADGGGAYEADSADSGAWGTPATFPTAVSEPCEAPATPSADDLETSWCSRLSPEPDQVYPTDPGAGAARCGFFNVTGAFGVAGVAAPRVMYCDADLDGGLRVAQWDDSSLSNRLDLAGECPAWAGSGSLVPLDGDDLLGAWAGQEVDGARTATPLVTARFDADGTLVDGPWTHPDSPEVARVVVPPGTPRLAVYIDPQDQLWSLPLSDDGATTGSAIRLLTGVTELAAAPATTGQVAVATCDVDLDLQGLDAATGALAWTGIVRGTDCDPLRRPGVAVLPDGTLLASWLARDETAHAALLGPTHAELHRYDLGPVAQSHIGPQIAAGTASFLVVASNGTGVVVLPSGAEGRRFHHPGVDHPDMSSLGLTFDDHVAVFAPVWMAVLNLGQHVYTYDVIELSSAVVVP